MIFGCPLIGLQLLQAILGSPTGRGGGGRVTKIGVGGRPDPCLLVLNASRARGGGEFVRATREAASEAIRSAAGSQAGYSMLFRVWAGYALDML